MKKFWKYIVGTPDFIYELIKNSNQDYLTSSYINFIFNDLFSDIFHPENISNSLYYVIEKLFESDINKLENINDFQKVITDSNTGFILGGLLFKENIQSYFSLVLTDIIEGYENSDESSKPIIFKIKDIDEYLKKEDEKFHKELTRSDTDEKRRELIKRQKKENYLFHQLYKMNLPKNTNTMTFCSTLTLTKYEEEIEKNKKENDLFIRKYVPDLNKKDLIEFISKEKNDNMKKYLQQKIKMCSNDIHLFSNQTLMNNIQKSIKSEKTLFFYQKSFIISINLINQILNKFTETIDAIPNSIKYISKIIFDLLKKKFYSADIIDIYKQVGCFFFMKLFKYIFLSPDYYPLINNVILSESTKKNIFKVFEIFSHLISGEFFKSNEETSDYTPFNWYFIDKINIVYDFCKKLISVQSPVQKKPIPNGTKDYFFTYSICFNFEIFETTINIIKQNSNILFGNKKHQKLKELIDNLLKNFETNKPKEKNIINYFLYFDIIYSETYKDLMYETLTNKNFKITESTQMNRPFEHKNSGSIKKKDEKEEKNLILAKNLMSDILIAIDENEINEIGYKIKNNSTKEMLKSLKNYYMSKSFSEKNINIQINNDLNKKNTPIEWYINSLIICLDKLSDYDSKNDFYNLYTSFTKDINNSIRHYNFKLLSQILDKLKYTKYCTKYIRNFQKKYVELIINSKIKSFIEKEKINVSIKLIYNLKEKTLSIYIPENGKEIESNKNNVDFCKNINDFISKFPNLTKIDKNIEPQLFEIEGNINLKGALNNYMEILKNKMKKYFKDNEKNIAFYKLKKYILSKIYEKIYPQDYDKDDLLFYHKTISLSWVEPRHLKIPNDIYVDNFIPITTSFFKQIDYEKSPSCKMEVIAKIFNTINSALRFSQGGNFSTDDIAPIFEYALIKARPERLSSNLRFLEYFITKGSELNNMYFDFLKDNMNNIKDSNYPQFDGVTEEEFKQKCYESYKAYIS